MPKLDKDTAREWRIKTENLIYRLNETIGNAITGENFYELTFRGKNHRPLLLLDGYIIATGIYNINKVLYDTCKFYHIF